MPNLLKSLPREILEAEDSKFIYNVLNPLLFSKEKETVDDTTVTHTVSSLLNKDINLKGKFTNEFILPFNINSREFHVYMTDGQENNKIDYFGNTELVKELDDLKDYIFFYFGVEGYDFLYDLIKKYYFILNEFEKNKKLYEYNYKKYLVVKDIKKKKVYKSTYEYFKGLYDKFTDLKFEFDLVITASKSHNDYSATQLVDNYARDIGNHLGIKTFDNEIVFENSKLFEYLNTDEYGNTVDKHVYSGSKIKSTTTIQFNNIFELIAIFAMEIYSIKEKYDQFLKLLVDHGNGYSMDRSEHKLLKNSIQSDVSLNLNSDNLTYFLNEEKNELEIYLYFLKEYRIDESTITLEVNNNNIPASIHSMNGKINHGYTILEYFDDETKYYKITVHDYLIYDINSNYTNYDINNIDISFDAIQTIYKESNSSEELYLESSGFLDNFVVYGKNEITGFFEKLNIPFKIKIAIDEKEDRYSRSYEIIGINDDAHQYLLSQSEIVVGCYDYDYAYEPKLYVDFFKYGNNTVNFRYNTIIPYVLIDDVMGEEFELDYYAEIPITEYSTNIHKNITMYDGKTYRKLYDEINHMKLLNPYNESNYDFVSKMSYSSYKERTHTNPVLITNTIENIPFKDNLKYLDKIQFDKDRNLLIFMYRGIQVAVPLFEGLDRGLNYEKIDYVAEKIEYCGENLCSEGFKFTNDGIYLKNPLTNNYDLIEATPTEQINLTAREREIFFDMFEMSHCVIIDERKYKVDGLYVDTYLNAIKNPSSVMFVESKYGIPRYKAVSGEIADVDFSKKILDVDENTSDYNGTFVYNKNEKVLTFRYTDVDLYTLTLIELDKHDSKHRQLGMSAFSIFYAGNVLPENSNKTFFGRENIYNSMLMTDDIYKIGKSGDVFNNNQHHDLLAEQLDLTAADAEKFNIEKEPYLMFKSSTASFKGLESYLKSNLKSISQDIGVSPVYLVQRNRFISEWARVSSVLPKTYFAEDALKDLVADLMETKLLNNNYDDLIDIFKDNEYEKFSLDTNNIHGILIQYILRFLEQDYLIEDYAYYLIHEVWIANNRKKIIDFIKDNASEQTIKEISGLTFTLNDEKEQLFYTFMDELGKIKKEVISSYIPLSNYSDWKLYNENNHVKFEKPYQYEVVDISDFITMPIEWTQPLYMIRPLVDDGVHVKRDFRFLDISMATNSQITYDDSYNEYVEDIKNKLNRPVDYLLETIKVLNELSLTNGFDMMSVNLVIVKWIVERYLPSYMTTNSVDDIETFIDVIKNELTNAEHPNLIVSYNKIKETTLLGDLGSSITDIYDSIVAGDMVSNTIIRMDVTSSTELEYLDKIKRPLEHYFDYLFYVERHDIITKILALFTEDVIATSMIDLSFAINIKNTKGDETYDIYEQMIHEIFDEFLPFHSVLDKIIFTIKIMETSSGEAIDKQLDTTLTDTAMIDILLDFAEKVKINTFDSLTTVLGKLSVYSAGLNFCGGHGEIPYDYDRKVKVAGHDVPAHMDDFESFGMDDEWYVVNRDNWRHRPEDIYTPPEFAAISWDCIPENEIEQMVETYIDDYYHIKTEIFEKDDRIESHFIDSIPIIDIGQGVSDNPEIDVTEDYLISIDSTYKIQFYDMELLGHDEFGLDESWGPDDQTALIGMKEDIRQNILHDFYEKMQISVMDSIWSDIVVVYNLDDIPGHDDFAIDEYYHQKPPEKLDQEISTMVYDELLATGFEIEYTDMSDISLIDDKLAVVAIADYREMLLDTVVSDDFYVTVDIITNRHFDSDGHFLRPAHDEFVYDEYYHNSADEDRADNMADIIMDDFMGDIRVDFGFMRMLPFDPYEDLIRQKFYRADLPGSDLQSTKIKDNFKSDIHMFSKDIIRVGLMDMYTLDLISEDTRRKVYEEIEEETFGGDWFTSSIADSLIKRHIHHDFRENIIAIDKYAHILSDSDILKIYGSKAAQFERDELFKLEMGDTVYSTIKVKHDVDRVRTKFDRDYLKSLKVEEDDFVEFRYMDNNIKVRFEDTMRSFYAFNDRSSVTLTALDKAIIEQFEKENIETLLLDRVHYGHRYEFEIDGMVLGVSDRLLETWSNKIHTDSLITSVTDIGELETAIDVDYDFRERVTQPHAEYGHMGYTEESLERSIDYKLTDSLIQVSEEMYFESTAADTYDAMMYDVHHYFGDYIDVVISDSLKTYVDIVRRPWIMPEYDNFGHDEYPHVYSGESDEFDMSTELRDSMKADAYTKLYETGSLIETHERIYVGYDHTYDDDTASVSMVDDVKAIVFGFKEVLNVKPLDITNIRKKYYERDTNIVVQDRVWYGYKLRDEEITLTHKDRVWYWYADDDKIRHDRTRVVFKDWMVFKYIFVEDKPTILLNDSLKYVDFGTSPKDFAMVSFKDSLVPHEHIENDFLPDPISVSISDKLVVGSDEIEKEFEQIVDADIILKDVMQVSMKESNVYGPGKKFKEKVMTYLDNRLYIGDQYLDAIPRLNINSKDSFHEYTTIAPFKDTVGVATYERMKSGLIFKDKSNIVLREMLDVGLKWTDDRYGVDIFPHSVKEMEYYDGSIDRSITTTLMDDVKMMDTHLTFGDSLIILSSDQLKSEKKATNFELNEKEGIVVSGNDNLMYGVGLYDYIWDAKEWNHYGYEVPYENWTGHIPHDDFPYDDMEHSDQGDDLSQIVTGVTDNLLYGFDYIFKETLSIKSTDKGGFSTWGYQSVFKDSTNVYVDNRLETNWNHDAYPSADVNFTNEFMSVSYEFDDKVKTHKFIAYNNGISTEEINIYSIDTHQLIETIMKYRIYEELDARINTDLLTSSLFRFDDEMSLVTDFKTKIDLYKAESDGSLTRSMTVIQDKSTAKVELVFNDGIMAVMKDKLHASMAESENQYL